MGQIATIELLKQANIAVEKGKNIDAFNLVKKATQQSPDDPRAWYLMSQLTTSHQGQIDCCKRALSLAPDNAQIKGRLEKLEFAEIQPVIKTVLCPFCSMEVPAKASICPYCRNGISKTLIISKGVQAIGALMFIAGLIVLTPLICSMVSYLGH